MNQYSLPLVEFGSNERQSCIDDLFRNIGRIGSINEIQDQAVVTASNEVFRMRFRCSTSTIAKCLPVIGFFASVYNFIPCQVISGYSQPGDAS
jgi:hypothetical protein